MLEKFRQFKWAHRDSYYYHATVTLIPFHIQDSKNLLRYVTNMSSHSSCILFQFLRVYFTGQEQEAHKEQEGKQKEGVSL